MRHGTILLRPRSAKDKITSKPANPGRRRSAMFHSRSVADVSAIDHRLRAIENELGRIGRKASRRASDGMTAAGEQVGDTLAPILNDIADRLRSGGRYAGDEAARFGNEAVKIGARVGNDALRRLAVEVEHRPLVTLAVAIGVGMLIGMAGRRH
jgi:ElaB/YqjD/DUF883 family membrane-anchored ribosome-binding protein